METTHNNRNNRFSKPCRNGCGKHIRWDNSQNSYTEFGTNQKHQCPNWKNPKYEHVTGLNHKITPEQQQYADTLGPLIAKILSLVQEIHQRTVQGANKDEQ
jgi:hypothetical protein